MINLQRLLLTYRDEHNLTQEEFAKQIGATRQSIADWETNRSTPKIDMLLVLSKILGCTVNYLMSSNPSVPRASNDFQFALYEGTKNLTEEQKKAIKTIIDGFNQKGK